MNTYDADGHTLREVEPNVWELDRDADMRVPARVFANEALLEHIEDDRTLDQLRNVACMPGVVAPALCMPDGHQGYGFPVGGVAAFDAEDGCISPGAVGFDINCLSGDSDVRLPFGRHRPIREFLDDFDGQQAVVAAGDDEYASDIRLATETRSKTVYEVETESGDTVEATADHPLRTGDGMVDVEDIEVGDDVFVSPFRGLPHEEPPEFVVLDESDFEDEDPQLIRVLKDRDLLPLKSTDEAFARLLKLVGFHTGDGSFSGSQTWFYGDPEDLHDIREDIEAVGFTPSKVYERDREHSVGGNEFERTEYSTRSTSNAFKQLLLKLGAPDGRKTDSAFTAPAYLDRLADWQTALYLSAFFGAEMSAPAAVSRTNLYAPSVSHNRLAEHESAGEQFLRDLMRHLNDLGVETNALEVVERGENADGETVRFRFGVRNDSKNLVRFFTTVGYRYNREKRRTAALAAEYLKRKERVVEERARIASEARAMADGGAVASEVKAAFDEVNDRFVERSLYGQRDGRPRPPEDFPGFEEFREKTEVREDFTVPSEVVSVTELGEKTVYDIGVTHDDHTFVANGFVVSNCGVRMVKTDLAYEDVQGREEELVDALFDAVPCGLGGGGVHDGDHADLEAALERGVDWCVEEGYATREDMLHCEDEGRRPEADPSAVSQKAKDRGANQMGSLGSGNHFLEVQRVTDVYDGGTADAFGLDEDQVVVLVHCGSRGLGHQVCSDYVRRIEDDHPEFVASLPEKDLAAAPAGSQTAADYYGAMCAAINFAWVNRQLVTHAVRETFADVFGRSWEALGMELLYDVAHNIAKRETHDVYVTDDGYSLDGDGGRVERDLYVHRKGATRAFPAGHPDVPTAYRDVGQPILIPGSMGAGSYVLKGGSESLRRSFGSTAHGAGRLMSRTQAKKQYGGPAVQTQLRDQNQIYVKAASGETIAEEAPGVYKDVDEVVGVSDALGIGDLVARTFPVCNVKG
ncbi:RtcB family protein [Halobacterium yunchengense]|uniref:RtcB family protein n=1 Tax=Halobacterium yunchengense TaxID=3108497 RepID=UPI003AB6995F